MSRKKTSKAEEKSIFFVKKVALLSFLAVLSVSGTFYLIFKKSSGFKTAPVLDLPAPVDYPEDLHQIPVPELTSKSIVVVDVDSKAILFEKNSGVATSPASITKIMSALVVLENFKLDQVLTVPDLGLVEGQKIKLIPGEKITTEGLLYALLVASANDAAQVFAKNFPLGQAGFVWAMNQKAKEIGLQKTNFTNPVGYDDPNHFSTSLDLARLAVFAMENPVIRRIVSTEKITIFNLEKTRSYPLSNINALIGKTPGVKGLKTGWTQQAGECLVTYLDYQGKRIVLVILGSQDRFGETEKLIDWIFKNFAWGLPKNGFD